jgi:hypothetical protein
MWRITAILLFGVLTGLSGFLGLWIADRDPPIALNNSRVMTPVVEPGGQLKVRYGVYRFRSCATHIDRWIFSGEAKVRTTLDDVDYQSSPVPLGPADFVAVVDIPKRIEPGPAVYRIAATYVCNPLHRIWPVKTAPPEIHFEIRVPDLQIPIEGHAP